MTEKKEAPKGILGKIKEKILPDEDEQAAIISTFVRLGVLVWSGGIQTASKTGDGTMKMSGANGNGVGKSGGPTQTIVIEQAPLKIIAESPKKTENYKM